MPGGGFSSYKIMQMKVKASEKLAHFLKSSIPCSLKVSACIVNSFDGKK